MDNFFKLQFAKILKELSKQGVTILMVSHDVEFCARYADLAGMFFDGGMVTVNSPEKFFEQNSFYTTAANRMSRHIFRGAITDEDVVALCRENQSDTFCLPDKSQNCVGPRGQTSSIADAPGKSESVILD